MAETEQSDVMSLTVTLLSAYFANNSVPSSELPALVEGTRKALLGETSVVADHGEANVETAAAETSASVAPVAEAPVTVPDFKPAVSIEESLASDDHILSLIDGKPYKALKRHLSTHGLTPAEYRARYSLPVDYPLVAPGYSAARREVALKLGLGGKRKAAAETDASPKGNDATSPEPAPAVVTAEKPAPVRKARAKGARTPAAPNMAKPKSATGEEKPGSAIEPLAAGAGKTAPAVEPTTSEGTPEKKAPVSDAGSKTSPVKASPRPKATNGKRKPAAANAAKPKRSRPPKVDPASTAPAASVDAPPAEVPAAE